jgi:hypothetical protein
MPQRWPACSLRHARRVPVPAQLQIPPNGLVVCGSAELIRFPTPLRIIISTDVRLHRGTIYRVAVELVDQNAYEADQIAACKCCDC